MNRAATSMANGLRTSIWLPAAVAIVMTAISIAVSLLLWWHDRTLAADDTMAIHAFQQLAARYLPEDVWEEQARPLFERAADFASPLPWIVLVGGVISAFGTAALVRALQSARREIAARMRAEAELKLANAQLHAVFDHSPIHIVLKDLEGRYVMVNREWARFHGEDAEAAIGKTPEEVYGLEHAFPVRIQEAEALRGSENAPSEIQLVAQGAERSVLVHKFAIRDESGAPLMLCGMGVDITERKRVEQELKRVNAELKSLLDNAPISIVMKDLEGRYLMVNRQWEQYFGRKAEDVIGKEAELVHGPDQARALRAQEAALLSSEAPSARQVEFTVDGETRTVLLNKFVVRDDAGAPIMFCGMDVDFTAQKRLEHELRENENRLRAIFDAMPNTVSLTDRNGRLLFVNPMARQFAEIPDDLDVRTVEHMSFIAPEHRGIATEAFKGALTGVRQDTTFDIVGRSGTRRTVEVVLAPYASDESGAVSVVLSVAKDVTEKRRLEARVRNLQRLESVGTLAGGVAHEFNNLLGVVLGNLDLLSLQLKGDDAKQKLLERIVASATRGAELAHSMLSFGRRAMLAPVPTDLSKLVSHAIAAMTDSIGKRITIDLVAAPDLAYCTIDPIMLESAINQLIANAVEAMPEGGRLHIEMQDRWISAHESVLGIDGREGHYVAISMADDGCGMTAEVRSRATEPFFTTKRLGQGSGLGLSMVHGFVHQSGGLLAIEPNPTGGTIVWMYLPAAGRIGRQDTLENQAPTMSSYKVLIVEDEDELRVVTATGLKRHGYAVVEARNAGEAIEALEVHHDIALLFSDIMLGGGMDGFQLAKWVSARRPAIQLLLTSGYAGAELLPADLAARGVPFLNKPYRLEGLVNQIAAMIGRPKVPLRVVS